jgi:hypothetical protein
VLRQVSEGCQDIAPDQVKVLVQPEGWYEREVGGKCCVKGSEKGDEECCGKGEKQ